MRTVRISVTAAISFLLIAANALAAESVSTLRKLASPPPGEIQGVSADGRYLIYITSKADFGLYEIATGQSRIIVPSRNEAAAYWCGVVAPDGKRLAYVWSRADGQLELYVTDIDHVQPKLIHQPEQSKWITLAAWSPDGRNLLVNIQGPEPNQWRIGLISVMDGSFRTLKSIRGQEVHLVFSADGRYIAYQRRANGTNATAGMQLINVETGEESQLLRHPADRKPITWLPDRNTLLFFSDRNGASAIWAADVADGQLAGEPRLVKIHSEGINPVGITRRGDFYFYEKIPAWDVHIAKVNFATGQVIESPKPATSRFSGYNTRPVWSNDGQRLAFHIEREPKRLSIVTLATGEQRQFPLNGKVPNLFEPEYAWSKNDSFILGRNRDSENRSGLYRFDTQTGSIEPYLLSSTNKGGSPEWLSHVQFAPDGRSFFYVRQKRTKDAGAQILRRNLETGGEEIIYVSTESLLHFALSQDAKLLAVLTQGGFGASGPRHSELLLVPAAEEGSRKPVTTRSAEDWLSVCWTPDGRRLLYIKKGSDPDQSDNQVWSCPAMGGESVKVNLSMPRIRYLSLHPDGETIAFQAGNYKTGMCVMENFLAQNAKAK
jgi:Tol biopolymer transport system component